MPRGRKKTLNSAESWKVTFHGNSNQLLVLGNERLRAETSRYYADDNLPIAVSELEKLDNVTVERGEFGDISSLNSENPTTTQQVAKEMTQSDIGVVWTGISSRKIVEVDGQAVVLQRGQANFNFSEDQIDQLISNSGYLLKVKK